MFPFQLIAAHAEQRKRYRWVLNEFEIEHLNSGASCNHFASVVLFLFFRQIRSKTKINKVDTLLQRFRCDAQMYRYAADRSAAKLRDH